MTAQLQTILLRMNSSHGEINRSLYYFVLAMIDRFDLKISDAGCALSSVRVRVLVRVRVRASLPVTWLGCVEAC